MQRPLNHSRRRFLHGAVVGLITLTGLPAWARAMEMKAMKKLAPNRASPGFHPDVEVELICRADAVPILSGPPTAVQRYFGRLLKGPADSLTPMPGGYLGPLLRLRKGQKVRIHLRSELDEPTITHWHGLHVPALMDGHPMYAIDRGETYVYEFEVLNRAGTYFYHPHPHEITARQVYRGLAGGLLVEDDEERALGLPAGGYEIPIVLQDRSFDAQNRLVYAPHGHDRMFGFYGERILVNGRADFSLDVATRPYRLRLVNGSTARIYKLGWSDGSPITVIGVDGGLLEAPVSRPYVMLAPGERLDVWADFSGRSVGDALELKSLPFHGALPPMAERMLGGGMGRHGMRRGMGAGHGDMGGGMRGRMRSGVPMGSEYALFKVRVTRKESDGPNLPLRLSRIATLGMGDVANPDKPVPLAISEGPMAMLLNGRPYAFDDVQPYERIPLGTVQLLEIFHAPRDGGGVGRRGMGMTGMDPQATTGGMAGRMHGGGGGGGMMFAMAHPIHLHGQQFQILSRTIAAAAKAGYDTVKDGFIDGGWKDTVLTMPGERIRLIKPFQDFPGRYMYHCHNLEHEDMGMMRDFLVE